MPKQIKFKNDKYKKVRGGYSRLLDISCEKCGTHLFNYQKDGPGILKRLYIDRIIGNMTVGCPQCKKVIGVQSIYEKENRPAIRLFIGSVTKKIIRSR